MSIPFSAAEAARWCEGQLVSGTADTRFVGVSTDTRADLAGCLFVAIRGPNHDAHSYLAQAIHGGASGLLVERADAVPTGSHVAVVQVDDTTRGLGRLAAHHRASFAGPVVAITGSNGKTTTKEMCAAILELAGPCLRNRGNLNNAYGLPLTLLEREAEHRTVVVEIGMNHRGEIAPLAAIARPTVGVITNVGTAHIEHLQSQDEIALEKGDLVAALGPDGVAVLNGDDERALAQGARSPAPVRSFGLGPGLDVRAENVKASDQGFDFRLVAPEGAVLVHVRGLGEPTVSNSLAAAAAALAAGASLDEVAEGLGGYQNIGGRMQRVALRRDLVVIDDTYNANPQSMTVALESLARLRGDGRAFAVLGDMGELGDRSDAAHREAGALAARLDVDHLFALGEQAGLVSEGAREAGLPAGRVHVLGSPEEAVAALAPLLDGPAWVLVKGSRAMRMERVVAGLGRAVEEG